MQLLQNLQKGLEIWDINSTGTIFPSPDLFSNFLQKPQIATVLSDQIK
jgi:hypothetical protein